MIRGLRSKQIWINDRWQSADLLFDEHGLIEAIKDYKSAEIDLIDHGALSVIPGLVDTHVHFNEPGREDWEGVSSGTAAAAAGGITTVVDMPLNSSPVTTTPETVGAKIAAVESKLSIDFAMHGGLVPENCDKMDALIQSGVLGIKAFLCPSGIDEFGHVGRKELEIAMPAIAASGLPLLVHAEVVHEVEVTSDPRNHGDYAATRPPSFERNAIEMMIELVEQTGCKVHIVHLADAGSIPALAAARGEGLPITVETCPHYLLFDGNQIPNGATEYKCAPPIRDAKNREGLWKGLSDGVIDMIASDHSPCPPSMKSQATGRFDEAWGGIASVEVGLPVIWDEAKKRGFKLENVIRWMQEETCRLANLKRRIEVGHPANLCIFDPNQVSKIDATKLLHRHPICPYSGLEVTGSVTHTYLRGQKPQAGQGRVVLRNAPEQA